MTRDEYLNSVSLLIRNGDRRDVGVKASTLGNWILRVLPHWSKLGYPMLKALLEDLRIRGLVRVENDSHQQLTVWVVGQPRVDAAPKQSFHRIRRDVWAAFVNARPSGDRFFNRSTGEVLVGQTQAPSPAEQWVAISPITDETQKTWARELIATLPQSESVREVLGAPQWYVRLTDALRAHSAEAGSRWNALRTARVVELSERWASQNNIDPKLLLVRDREARTAGPRAADRSGDASIRQTILDALAKLSTEQLLEIPIPAKYLISAASRDPD